MKETFILAAVAHHYSLLLDLKQPNFFDTIIQCKPTFNRHGSLEESPFAGNTMRCDDNHGFCWRPTTPSKTSALPPRRRLYCSKCSYMLRGG